MNKVLSYIITALSVFLLSLGMMLIGFRIGTDFEAKEIDKENNKIQINDLVAIVNLDEGVLENGATRYYSSELITIPEVGYEKCSLMEAREGIGNGRYGAYIIIPATFSEAVRSVDKDLLKVELKYDLNPYLTDEVKQKMINTIFDFQNSISDSISYAYVYSILDEYHSIQDSSAQILENDKADLESIMAVDPDSIAQDVQYSKIEKNEYEIQSVDFSGNKATIQTNYEEINQYYKDGFESGKTAYQAVVNTNNENVNNKINELKDIEKKDYIKNDDGSYVYDAGISKLEEEMNMNKSASDRISEMREEIKKDAALRDAIIQEYVDEQLKAIQEENKAQMNLFVAEVEAAYDAAVVNYQADNLANPLPADLITTEMINQYGIKSSERGLVENPSADKVRININNITIQPGDIVALSDDKKDAIMFNINPYDGFQRRTFSFGDDLEAAIEDVFADSDEIKQIINEDIIKPSKERIDSHVKDIDDKCDEVIDKFSDYNNALSSFDMYGYIETDKIVTDIANIQTAISNLSADMNTQISEYENYVSETDRIANENIANLLEDIGTANSQTKENLNSSIEELKGNREELNKTNTDLLLDFTNHLSYTRIGDLENTTVYDFIVSPVDIDQTDTGLTIEQYKRRDYNNMVMMTVIISMGLCIVVYCGKILIYRAARKRKK